MTPERKVWLTVLERAVWDALWPRPTKSHDTSGVPMQAQREARAWFGTKDFRTVCHLAGMCPEFIGDHVRPMIDRPPEERERWLKSMAFGGHRRRDFHRTRSAA
jgi:hypothetical protein